MHAEEDDSKLREKALALHAQNRLDEALSLYQALLILHPEEALLWARVAVLRSQQGFLKAALGLYARSLVLCPNQAQTRSNLARVHLALGDRMRAEVALKEALSLEPGDFPIVLSLALFTLDFGNAFVGVRMLEEAMRLDPLRVEPWARLGEYWLSRGDFARAQTLLRGALQKDPLQAHASFLLANALFSDGDPKAAQLFYQRALSLEPAWPDALGNLGLSLDRCARSDAAFDVLQRAVQLSPEAPSLQNNFGSVAYAKGLYHDAERAFSKAMVNSPSFMEAWLNRARSRLCLQHFEAALIDARATFVLEPASAPALEIMALCLNQLRDWKGSSAVFLRAMALSPEDAAIRARFGSVLDEMRFKEEALRRLKESLCLDPALPQALIGVSAGFWQAQSFQKAISFEARAVAVGDQLPFAEGELLHRKMQIAQWPGFEEGLEHLAHQVIIGLPAIEPFSLLALKDDPELQLRCAEIYCNHRTSKGLETAPPSPPQEDRIRLGYFSSDFRDHPVAHLIAGLLERHDRSRFKVVAFSYGGTIDDPWRRRIEAAVDDFREVTLMSDEAIAAISRAMGIDIAIDLNGHTLGARPGIFALRAAPVQIHYIGYLGTLGAPWMDYLIADRCVIPETERPYYREKIIALPVFQANEKYQPIHADGARREAEGLPEYAFVYCCFNNNFKLTPAVFSAWIRILKAVPQSVVWLYASNPLVENHLKSEACRQGLDASRLIFARRRPLEDHLKRLTLADVFLDTHPYNAGATASNALRAGVPVLTYLGRSFVSRMSGSLIQAAGLEALVARDLEDYVEKAIALGHNPSQLERHKHTLRSGLSGSDLFDTSAFARHLEQAFDRIHARHLAGLPPEHLVVDKASG